MDLLDFGAVERSVGLRAVVKADHRNANGGTIEHPRSVGPSHEDGAAPNDLIQYQTVGPPAYRIGCHESGTHVLPRGDLLHRAIHPVADQVGFTWDQAIIGFKKSVDVDVAKAVPKALATEERGISSGGNPLPSEVRNLQFNDK